MSERINTFCTSLQTKLNNLEGRMKSLKTNLQSAPKQAGDALHKQLEQAQKKVQSQKQAFAKARASVQNWADEKKAEAKATVNQWKAEHDARKLDNRADRAEEYAVAAIEVAVASIDEAEQAVFEAIAARLDAEAVPVG
jgi:membrane protein involved in colicin uptake